MTEYDVWHFIFGLLGATVAEAYRLREVFGVFEPQNSPDIRESQKSKNNLNNKYKVISGIMVFGGGVLAMGILEGVQQYLILASFIAGLGAEATFTKVIHEGLDVLGTLGGKKEG
jgi:hypothetical protein